MPEPVRPFFDNHFVINDGKWYGMYFPGHPAALALGELFHLMGWVPAVSAALTVPLTFAVGRRAFGQRVALLSLPLLVLSPFFILSSATLLAQATAELLLMAFVYAVLRVIERPEHGIWWVPRRLPWGGRDSRDRCRPRPSRCPGWSCWEPGSAALPAAGPG
jgi:hypothetical protein